MRRFLLNRIAQGILVLLVVSVVTFGLLHLAPGGPSILIQPGLDAEQIRLARQQLGLDDPFLVQYGKWVLKLMQGDLGRSFIHREAVSTMIASRLPASLTLAAVALLLTVAVGLPLAVVSATRRHSLADYLASLLSFIGISLPSFWFGILLIILFSVKLRWLPSSGMATIGKGFDLADRMKYLIMPAVVLGFTILPQVTRYARSSLLNELFQDYVRSARAKGLEERRVIYKHVLKNALLPVVTVIGFYFPRLVGGTIVVESVFSWPGMGLMAYRAASDRDYPVVLAVTVVVSILVITANLLTDLLYVALDPRVRYE